MSSTPTASWSSWINRPDRANETLAGEAFASLGFNHVRCFQCAGCGQWNDTTVDESAGPSQSCVEDCQVCCKPNLLSVHYDCWLAEFVITARLEDA